ncbi:MAG: M20/M25/M40 family metallo-hydrolase, partial [Candidatus Poribacteria bacterium]
EKIENVLSGMTSAHGASYNFSYQEGYPVTYNHESCSTNAFSIMKMLVDEGNISYPYPPLLGGEDFGYYSQKIPACFIFLGAGNKEKGIVNMCHDPRFDVDEKCMIYGMAMHASLALSFARD